MVNSPNFAYQYETIFKGTTLAAAIAGFTMSGTVNKRRSVSERS